MSEAGVKRADLLRLLLRDTTTSTHGRGWVVRAVDGGEFFLAEGVVRVPPGLACAMVRDADLTPLAGSLAEWKVTRKDAASSPPNFARCVQYTSRLPWPFANRNFEVESWFLPSTSLPPHLARACVYVSQTPEPTGRSPLRLKNVDGVDGDVEFSGYCFMSVPGSPEKCFIRRVISVDLKMPLPKWMLRSSFLRVFESDFVWMDRPPVSATDALRERIASDPAYVHYFTRSVIQ